MREKPWQQLFVLALAPMLLLTGCRQAPKPAQISASKPAAPSQQSRSLNTLEARLLAKQAYIFGVPMVASYRRMYASRIDKAGPQYKGSFNTIENAPTDKAPGAATPDIAAATATLDLRAEPVVITVPKIPQDRYFVLQLTDMYTFNFAYIGSRATGNDGGVYMIPGPDWKGDVPAGITKTFPSETEFVHLAARDQMLGPADLAKVKKLQSGYKIQPLHEYLHTEAPPAPPAVDWPAPVAAAAQTSAAFFSQLAFLLQFATPPHPSEVNLRNQLARIGIVPGKPFDFSSFTPDVQSAILAGINDGQKAIDAKRASLKSGAAALYGSRAYLKSDYLARATGAEIGLGRDSREESDSQTLDQDSNGQPLDGSQHRYILHFAKDQLPPVNGFWSLTLYDLPKQQLVKNPFRRYQIDSSMLPRLKTDADGGLTIYIQPVAPVRDKRANWLPAPKGPFTLTMRYYWPKPEFLNGQWKLPAIQPANQAVPVK